MKVGLDDWGNVDADGFETSVEGVFAAGDARVGASLIVTAIAEGRRCARAVEAWLRERSAATR
jgi:glutamate synthase (NADPH/NADH) small chain